MMNSKAYALPGALPSSTARKPKFTGAYWGPPLVIFSFVIWLAGFAIGFQRSLTIVVVISLGAMILGLRWPALGLMGIGIMSAVDPLARWFVFDLRTSDSSLLRFNTLNYLLLLAILTSLPFLARLNDVQSRLMQILLLVLVIGFLISPYPFAGVQHLLNVVVLFGMLAYFARAADDLSNLYWLGVVVGVMAALGNLCYYVETAKELRINPNSGSYFALMGIFTICLAFPFAEKERRGQTILLLLAVVNFIWVFLSTSRGSLLIAIVGMLFLLGQIRSLSRRFFVLIAAVLLGLAISSQFTELQDESIERIEKLLDSNRSMTNRTSRRSDIMLVGWETFVANPFGIGTGGYANVSGMGQAHSAWVKVLAENGIQGILVFASYVFSFGIVGWLKRRQGLFGIGMLGTVVLSVAFISNEFHGKGLWFLAAGVTMLLHRKEILTHLQKARRRRPPALTITRPGLVNRV